MAAHTTTPKPPKMDLKQITRGAIPMAILLYSLATIVFYEFIIESHISIDDHHGNPLQSFIHDDESHKGPLSPPLLPPKEEHSERKSKPKGPISAISEFSERDESYRAYRTELDTRLPYWDTERILNHGKSARERIYVPIDETLPYNVYDCPYDPPPDYPKSYPILDITAHWNPDDTSVPEGNKIHLALCIFDKATEFHKAEHYQKREVPFILRDDPIVLQAVERWAQPGYLSRILGGEEYTTEHSDTNHFMFYRVNKKKNTSKKKFNSRNPPGWKPPTSEVKMTYDDWLVKAEEAAAEEGSALDKEHWYFRLNAKGVQSEQNRFVYDELPFFRAEKSFHIVDTKGHRGINCRFGAKGIVAENHFDGSRNSIVLLGGERRYMLAHPDQCENLCLHPSKHPSGRHSAVDWANPDLGKYPKFKQAMGNEVVLQGGDFLYLPTFWFHYIISLGTNWQCNTRSGYDGGYQKHITNCGF